jgi:glycosyltransferase involved in cell wall biosynthesis
MDKIKIMSRKKEDRIPPGDTDVITAVIPCLNCAGTVARLVSSLRQQRLPQGVELEIIVVDNGSTDDTAARLEGSPVRIVREDRRGPAAARNAGVLVSRGDIILFLDADTRPCGADFVLRHLETFNMSGEIGIAGGAISPDPEQESCIAFAENATGLFNWHDRMPPGFISFQPMGNMACRRTVFARCGLLDEDLLSLEDFEWNVRVRRAGYRVFFNPKAGVYITGRESLRGALAKFYAWGLNLRQVYVPGRADQLWFFRDRPCLFSVNGPLRILNETYVTIKRWLRVRPMKTLLLCPLFLLFRTAWGIGIVVGGRRYLLRERNMKT